jgi:hypothetical protein
MRAPGPRRRTSALPLRSRAGHAELVPGWIEQHHPAIAVRRAIVVRDLRAQRQKAIDLRITVPVTWLKADMHTILHGFVLWNGLEEQPGVQALSAQRDPWCARVGREDALSLFC